MNSNPKHLASSIKQMIASCFIESPNEINSLPPIKTNYDRTRYIIKSVLKIICYT